MKEYYVFVTFQAGEMKSISHYLSLVTPIDLLMTSRGIAVSLIGAEGKQLLLHTTFSQPHTVISTKPGAERVEISCYNMGIVTGKPNTTSDEGTFINYQHTCIHYICMNISILRIII